VQASNSPSPFTGIVLVLAILGAIADRHYKKIGGDRPIKAEKWGLAIAVAVCIALMGWGVAEALGVTLAVWVFGGWEAWRWRVRRDNPIFPSYDVDELAAGRAVVKSTDREEGALSMEQLNGQDLTILQDACGVHDFTPEERHRIHEITQELNSILDASKKRDQERISK